MKFKLLFFLIAGMYLFGCNYEFSNSSENAGNSSNSDNRGNQAARSESNDVKTAANAAASNKTGEKVENSEGGKLVLSDTGKVAVYPCNGREVEIEEPATANDYTLTGECKKLTVNGVSNKIKVDKVGAISVTGVSNKIAYGEGLNNQKPPIKKSGTDNSVETVKSQEEKKEAANKKVS